MCTFVAVKLIADSGSTKTDWVVVGEGVIVARIQTQGINPFHQSENAIEKVLREELLPRLPAFRVPPPVFFYGSGVRPELKPVLERLLSVTLPVGKTEAHSDLLGAARAVCGPCEGIACILGTGANSCLYDGVHIVQSTPPLGYILGDEGSGAVLGIRLLNMLYKGFASRSLLSDFEHDMRMNISDVVARIYRQPLANRFLASLSPFVHTHLDDGAVCNLVIENFRDFFRRNLVQYHRHDLAVGFVGSIASVYAEQLRVAAGLEGFKVGQIKRSPMDGLLLYHDRT